MAQEKSPKTGAQLNYRSSLVIVAVGLLIAIGIGFWLGSLLNQLNSQIQEQNNRIAALDRREESYRQLESDFQSIKKEYSKIDQALPDQNNFVAFIVLLERESKKQGVKLEIDFPDEPQIENGLLSFTIKIFGQQENVLKYLIALKDSPYYIEVATLQLNKAGPANASVGEATIKVGIDETFQPSQISS